MTQNKIHIIGKKKISKMETIQLTLKFTHKLSPENNDNYKKNLAIFYLKSKGIKAWVEDDRVVFE